MFLISSIFLRVVIAITIIFAREVCVVRTEKRFYYFDLFIVMGFDCPFLL